LATVIVLGSQTPQLATPERDLGKNVGNNFIENPGTVAHLKKSFAAAVGVR
jgi:hypothetical protein